MNPISSESVAARDLVVSSVDKAACLTKQMPTFDEFAQTAPQHAEPGHALGVNAET